MSTVFAQAPLIEIIAELKWTPKDSTGTPAAPPIGTGFPTVFIGGNKQEEFYARVANGLEQLGYRQSERLLPFGVPFALHQPIYRYRSSDPAEASVIYQVGYGLFSVHGVPPYHSWATFLPFVEKGVDLLVQSRVDVDAKTAFSAATLRYIDFFSEYLMGGRDVAKFMSEVMGISTTLPAALAKVADSAPNNLRSLFTKLVFGTSAGIMSVSVGDGTFSNRVGIMLDTVLASAGEMGPSSKAIMEQFESAHTLVHGVFMDLTHPIHGLMKPENGG